VLGQSPHGPQLRADHLPGPLFLRLPAWTLPDAYNRGTHNVNEALDRFHQVILEASAAKLPIGKDVDANAALML
jgi:hypothetical protein